MTTLIETVFNKFDCDGSGSITRAELAAAFSNFADSNGAITRDAFVTNFVGAFSECSNAKAGSLFDSIDGDSSGTITTAELEKLYTGFDNDGSDTITLVEFKTKWGNILSSD